MSKIFNNMFQHNVVSTNVVIGIAYKMGKSRRFTNCLKECHNGDMHHFKDGSDVLTLVLLFLYVDLIDTWSGFDIQFTITNKNCQKVRAFHHGTF